MARDTNPAPTALTPELVGHLEVLASVAACGMDELGCAVCPRREPREGISCRGFSDDEVVEATRAVSAVLQARKEAGDER